MEDRHVLIHLVELFINTVLYQRRIYPDGIFRKRRAYSTFAYVTIFPPLVSYLKKVLEVCQVLIEAGSLNVIDVVLLSDKEEIECHELKINKFVLPGSELEIEEHVKHLLIKQATKLRNLRPLPPNTTFRIDVHTTFGSLRDINQNTRFQDFPWIKNDESKQFNSKLLYNPICLDDLLGIDIAVNQRVDSFAI